MDSLRPSKYNHNYQTWLSMGIRRPDSRFVRFGSFRPVWGRRAQRPLAPHRMRWMTTLAGSVRRATSSDALSHVRSIVCVQPSLWSSAGVRAEVTKCLEFEARVLIGDEDPWQRGPDSGDHRLRQQT